MKKITKILLGTVLVVTTLGAVKVFAGGSGCGFAHYGYDDDSGVNKMAERISHRVDKELDLNEDQESMLDALVKQVQTVRKDAHANRSDHKAEILLLLSTPILDQERALAILSGKLQSIDSVAPQVISAIANFTDSLDAAQREKIINRMEHHSMGRH